MKVKNNENVKQEPAENDVKLNVKRRKCTLSDKMQEMMIRQLASEMYNHNLYRSFANFYGVRGLNLLEKYYNARAEEEMKHHTWVLGYLSTTDTEYIYPEIKKITDKWETLEDPFDITIDAEIETTQLINEMVELAVEEGDWATFHFLMDDEDDTGMLVKEQVNFCLIA